MRLFYLWTTRLLLALSVIGFVPNSINTSLVVAQSKKKNPAQASKYAKRGSSKAKKKDYRGALSDYKKAYQLNPTANYKKRVQQLTSLAKKSGSSSSNKKPTKKQASQAAWLLQPGWENEKGQEIAILHTQSQPKWRLSLQSHKWLKVR